MCTSKSNNLKQYGLSNIWYVDNENYPDFSWGRGMNGNKYGPKEKYKWLIGMLGFTLAGAESSTYRPASHGYKKQEATTQGSPVWQGKGPTDRQMCWDILEEWRNNNYSGITGNAEVDKVIVKNVKPVVDYAIRVVAY